MIPLSQEDKEIVMLVVSRPILLYLLELKLGDCHRVASIRREVVHVMPQTGHMTGMVGEFILTIISLDSYQHHQQHSTFNITCQSLKHKNV